MKQLIPVSRRAFLAALLALSLAIGSCAWFFSSTELSLPRTEGSVRWIDGYFDGGTGLDNAHPYWIRTPQQLYNLAWLQYLGYFNEQNASHEIPTVYFKLAGDLDMTGYILPPIGTANYPFLGNFDGNSKTISNLTVSNTTGSGALGSGDNSRLPLEVRNKQNGTVSALEICGFFGVFGAMDDSPDYTYDRDKNSAHSFTLSSLTVTCATSRGLAGLAVGYANGKLQSITITNGTLAIDDETEALGGFSNLSDHSFAGSVSASYETTGGESRTEGGTWEFPSGTVNILPYEPPDPEEGQDGLDGAEAPADEDVPAEDVTPEPSVSEIPDTPSEPEEPEAVDQEPSAPPDTENAESEPGPPDS